MRHSVELRLKSAILELKLIEKSRSRELQFDSAESHDIGNIWRFFSEKARAVDDRYEKIIGRLDGKIADIAEVDATGQTFRYPLDTKSKKHLVDISIINFAVLKQSFAELEAALDDLHSLSIYLRNEYDWGSFTKRLSRKNLFELAFLLPPRSAWKEEEFDDTKNAIKKRFDIGSKELTESIKCIESHFELAPEIGLSIPLLGVEEDYLKNFFNHWFKLNNFSSDKCPVDLEGFGRGSGETFSAFVNGSEIRDQIWNLIKSDLTPEKLAGVSALFYFARELDFSENYVRIYEDDLREAKVSFENSEDAVKTQYFHVLEKTNAVYNILRSLYFLRKSKFADRLVAIHGLDEKYSWLEEARKRTLFQKPDYCGYTISQHVESDV